MFIIIVLLTLLLPAVYIPEWKIVAAEVSWWQVEEFYIVDLRNAEPDWHQCLLMECFSNQVGLCTLIGQNLCTY